MTTVNTDNLTIGGCELYFASGEASPADATMADPISLGNIVVSEVSPKSTYVQHYVAIKQKRVVDNEHVNSKGLVISLTFDEISKSNLQLFFQGGTIDGSASRMPIMSKSGITGRAILNFKTDIGTKFMYVVPKCVLKADGGLPLRAEDWVRGKFTLDVLYHKTYHMHDDNSASFAPYGYLDFTSTNIGSPF